MHIKTSTYPEPSIRLSTGLAFLLLLLLAIAQLSSNGVVRGGDDNEGSGIGGTGRALQLALESGIGGTGIKPFLSVNATNEIEILQDPAQRDAGILYSEYPIVELPRPAPVPVKSVIAVMRELEKPLDSSAIDLSVVIQEELAINAPAIEQLRTEIFIARDESNPASVTWNEIARLLRSQEATPAAADTSNLANLDYPADNQARLARPERVQRPELPPTQRVSPLQRTAILPPPVLPLRL